MSWAAKKDCSLPNYDDEQCVALSNSGEWPAGSTTARESEHAFEKFSDVAVLVYREK